jgi:hypothetical protein
MPERIFPFSAAAEIRKLAGPFTLINGYVIQRIGALIRYNAPLFDALLKNGPVF